MKLWSNDVRRELELARQARSEGNEGRARVCARRAGGIAAREYLKLLGDPAPAASAYDLLNRLSNLADVPQRARQSAVFLTMRVDEEFKLPEEVDLIAEAGVLCRTLHPGLEI
jgi:HEPN domain-containing protein